MQLNVKPEEIGAASRVVSDEDLWISFQNGEDAAFNMLYVRYADRLYGYLKLLLTTAPQQLDDLYQEAWILIFKERSKFFVSGRGSFGGWLFRVVHNLAISLLRKDQYQTISLEDLTIDTELIEGFVVQATQEDFERPSMDQILLHVVQAVEELPLLLREVFVLSEFDRLTLDQIGETLGISRTNAKVRLFRARRVIRERMSKVLDVSTIENL